ncbi:MAG: HD-GYP domain-containing protein [Gammaproteobacteria bacterium]
MKKTKIDTKNLAIGMYVTKLDKSWLETPFRFQGFRIESEKQLQQVRDICAFVYIDEEKSDSNAIAKLHNSSAAAPPSPITLINTLGTKASITTKKPFEEEFPVACEIYQRSSVKLQQIMDNLRYGRNVDPPKIAFVVHSVMESVARNHDALLLLSNLKLKNEDTVRHAIHVCILSLVFGRYLNLGKELLSDLGFAALLHDAGEIRIPKEILEKRNRGVTPEERKILEKHTQLGAEILRENHGIPAAAIDVALSHHERIDGKGYPRGLKGQELSFFAKLVAIVEVYESVTNNPGAPIQVSSSDALRSIYSMRDTFFDGDLVENFIKCLGIYPVGSVVELNTGEIGIVISLKPEKHLLPTLMIVRNKDKRPCYPPYVMNLDSFRTEEGKPQHFVTEVLEPNAYGIDLSDVIVREINFGGH